MLAHFFQLNPPAMANEGEAELGQAKVRIAILICICLYIAVLGADLRPSLSMAPWAQTILLYYLFYTPLAVLLFLWVQNQPGHYPGRRIASMFLDYGSLGYSIVVAPMQMLPLHTIILWVTMGHGLRFGKRYLWIATGFALVTVATVCSFVPQSENSPFMLTMLLLSVCAIPHYASSLLKRVEHAREEAEAANLAKSRFLAQASHDLRQPLHAINLFLVSLQQTGLKAAQKTIVDRIDRSLQGVANLFRSLLDVSTLDSGAISPKLEPVALGQLLQDIVDQNRQLAEWSATDLRLVNTSKVVLSDHTLLTTMVQNLVSNAMKFATGSAILVGCRVKGGFVSIEIFDQGEGIAPEHLPHLFDEFFQIRKSGDPDRQGVGLGLSIVSRMAQLLNLEVRSMSDEGKGSRFTIANLPIIEACMNEAVRVKTKVIAKPLTGFSVLLVEDDLDILAATKELLESWGCVVVASAKIPDTCADIELIITDFDLGGGQNGADCIARVRDLCGWGVPAIVITGHDESRIAQAIGNSSIPVLKKPLRPAEMRSAISAARARLRSQVYADQ